LGLGSSLRRWRTPGVALILIWLALMMVLGSLMTVDAPFWPRLIGIVPAAALLIALSLDQIWAMVEGGGLRQVAPVLGGAVVVFLLLVGWKDWQLYYKTVQNDGRPQARIGRFFYNLPPQVAACMFVEPYYLQVRETAFLAWPRQTRDLPSDTPDELLGDCPGPPFAWVLTPNHLNRLDALRARWPDGIVQENRAPDNSLLFTTYRVFEGHGGQSGQSSSGYLDPAFIGVSLVMAVLFDLGLMFLARRYWQKRGVGRKDSQVVRVFGQFSPVLTWLKYGRLK